MDDLRARDTSRDAEGQDFVLAASELSGMLSIYLRNRPIRPDVFACALARAGCGVIFAITPDGQEIDALDHFVIAVESEANLVADKLLGDGT